MRIGMNHIIRHLRELCSLGTADYTLVVTPYWSDDQIQDVADRRKVVLKRVPLTAYPVNVSNSPVYKHYEMDVEWIEGGTTNFRLYDSPGTDVSSSLYTLDPVRGFVDFSADTGGSVYYADVIQYPMDELCADIWTLKLSHIADNSFNIRIDNHTLNRQQRADLYRDMIDYYRNKIGVRGTTISRGDM